MPRCKTARVDSDEPTPRKPLPLDLEAVVGDDPAQTLEDIIAELHSRPDPDEEFISMIGIGPLESLLHQSHGEALWPEIERLVRRDVLFRRALRSVRAYDSPEFDRRTALLEELTDEG
jgi:hypothetical protein